MPKNKKNKPESRSSSNHVEPSVCTCLGLVAQKTFQRTSVDALRHIDGKCAVLHWSDACKIGLHHGESALIISSPCYSSADAQDVTNDRFIATVCSIRISPSNPQSNDNNGLLSSSGRSSFSRRDNVEEKATCGNVLLSADVVLHDDASIRRTEEICSTKIPNTSPTKSSISCKMGKNVEPLLSPTPTKYTSPSGSKFSFSKGGGGERILSPGLAVSSTRSKTQCTKFTQLRVLVAPLRNLSTHQLGRLCPDAQTIQVCPVNDADKSCNATDLMASCKILQTLIISKYNGTFFQMQGEEPKQVSSVLDTIYIPFRGLTRYFHVVGVTPVPFHGSRIHRDDRNNLASHFEQLDIADKTSAMTQDETQFMDFFQYHNKQCTKNGGYGVACKITHRTNINFVSSIDVLYPAKTQAVQNSRHIIKKQRQVCAGLDSTLSRIKDVLLPPLMHPNLFPSDGPLRPPKGALLYGPAGVGKSLIAVQIANDLSVMLGQEKMHVQIVPCAEIISSTAIVGEAEKLLSGIFDEAEKRAMKSGGGSLIILDDVHLICPRRGGMGGAASSSTADQVAGTLLALLDGIGGSQTNSNKQHGGRLIVLAITTDPSTLDPALRRPGRLDVEMEVSVPDDRARADIIKFHLLRSMTEQRISEVDTNTLARLAKGFTGADCKMAVKEAVRIAMSRMLQDNVNYERGEDQCLSSISVQSADLEHAIRMTKPSAIKSVAVEVPSVPWSAIGGMDDVKALLKESIELPLTHPHLFEMMQVPPPKGILLYGPPGCSKTLCARAIATEGNMNFLAVKGPELLSKWLGESERALASLFRRARLAAPAVIFFDELDSIASTRGDGGSGSDRLLSQLLTELDGVTSGGKGGRVVVVGATNRPDVLDAALTRPGRMDRMIYVGLPDEKGRRGIFKIGLEGKDCHEDVNVSLIDKITVIAVYHLNHLTLCFAPKILALASDDVSKGYSGAEIIALCRDAALHAIGEMDEGISQRPQIHMKHLLRSVKEMTPHTSKSMLQFYESFRGRH